MLAARRGAVIVIEVETRRGRRAAERREVSPGGAALRALRERAGRTQLWVEAEADLGTGYLQRLECGRVTQPVRATVERILAALGARYSERREVLELFGYTVTTPLPDEEEIIWATVTARRELHDAAFPVYLLDCAHRLIAWNRFVPALFGLAASEEGIGRLARRSLPSLWFDPASPLAALVAEPAAFLPALVRAFRYEMQLFRAETWYPPLFAELWALPLFRRAWTLVEREPATAGAARALVPVRLAVPGAGTLQFRLSSEHFTRDTRFRLVNFFPADPATMRWCAGLAEGGLG
jgi:transcriptional regulator with XRE-family HTH domain